MKPLGSMGLMASELGLGCMGMSEFYGQKDDLHSLATLQRAYELGVTFWDTADMYGPYLNEELLSRALKGIRQQITLATKFGITRNSPDATSRGLNGRAAYVFSSCEGSLKRLEVETIDLYYLHRVDPDTPIEETIGAMAELVKQGKVRGIGLSEASVETLKKAHAIHPISAVQTEYSLWSREPENGMLDTCRELGIAFVAYSPLGRGFLTGQITRFEDLAENDWRRTAPRFMGENFEKNLALVQKVKHLAAEKKCTPAQLALAWVMAKGDHIFPIPGTKKISYLEENIGALEVSLSKEELQNIDAVISPEMVAGTRYTEAGMKSVNR